MNTTCNLEGMTVLKNERYLELIAAIERALYIEKAHMKDLENDYGVKDSGFEKDNQWVREHMESMPEFAAIKSNIEFYEKVLKK